MASLNGDDRNSYKMHSKGLGWNKTSANKSLLLDDFRHQLSLFTVSILMGFWVMDFDVWTFPCCRGSNSTFSLKNTEVNISKGAENIRELEFAINLDRKFEGICRYTILSSGRIVMVLQFYSEIIHFFNVLQDFNHAGADISRSLWIRYEAANVKSGMTLTLSPWTVQTDWTWHCINIPLSMRIRSQNFLTLWRCWDILL